VNERVRFVGNYSQDQVATLFAASDAIAAPSIKDDAGNVDGLPNVVMEALASGTPLVTTRAGGIGAVVEDGSTALVVPERDAQAIAVALSRLHAEPDLRSRVGAAGRQLVIDRFGWERTAEALEHAYSRALALPRARR
jgi:glycosyltransferase involved in cell wall biosynthesis